MIITTVITITVACILAGGVISLLLFKVIDLGGQHERPKK